MAKKKNITRKRVQSQESKPYVPQVEAKAEEDEGPFDEDGLCIRRRLFVEAITGAAAGNASKAAEMAGYAAENRNSLAATASRLLNIVKVREAISAALAKKRLTPQWAKNQLANLAASSMENFVVVDVNGEESFDFKMAAAAGALGQIREIKQDVIRIGDGDEKVIKRTIKVHNQLPALLALLRMQGVLDNVSQNQIGDEEIRVRAVTRRPEPPVRPANPSDADPHAG